MSFFIRDKKGDEDDNSSVFKNLDKAKLLQETRYFNSSSVNPRKCIHILTKILYLLNQGEKLSTQESTEMFFATTKLFQSKDVSLRRLVYLCIKELSPMAQDLIIVTSSLTKDMTGREDLYRAAAIRAFCKISYGTMLQAVERHMKQAIVDKNPAVSSAALVSAIHLTASVPDLVKRWINEAQEVLSSDNGIISYHALAVVATLRKNDRLAMVKLVTKLIRTPIVSPYTCCLLIRFAAKLAKEDSTENSEPYIEFIESCLRNKNEMVIYEAAHAIINLRKTTVKLAQAVSVLQIFCGSSRASHRLAGVRTLSKFTEIHSDGLIQTLSGLGCLAITTDLENLITDKNRSIATLAVTTLLATGAENSIDRLMKTMAGFMTEISDEFKIIVVRAIHRLSSKYPRKYRTFLTFLSGILRDEGGYHYKSAVTDAIIAIIEENLEAKEVGLAHLCELIEDCEHIPLAIRILYVLGREGPKARNPSRYIRYIYNRVILESGSVRAAAVSAVARFGAACPDLLPNIRVLLSRCLLDEDDAVRDRAVFYSSILDSGVKELINEYILNVQVTNFVLLEKSLQNHLEANPDIPFDINTVPSQEENVEIEEKPVNVVLPRNPCIPLEELYANELKTIPLIEKLGSLFKTFGPIDLTEPETEYRVRCIKYVYAHHLILQFECLNTLSDQLLENVHVRLDVTDGYKVLEEISCVKLPYDKQGSIFCVLEFPAEPIKSLGTFGVTLEFVVRDCDPITGLPDSSESYSDTYPIEDVEIGCAEQLRSRAAPDDWQDLWEKASTAVEICDTFVLSQTDVNEAAIALCKHLDLPKSAISGDSAKEIRSSSYWRSNIPVLLRACVMVSQGVVTVLIAVRSSREDVATLLLAAMN